MPKEWFGLVLDIFLLFNKAILDLANSTLDDTHYEGWDCERERITS